MGIRMGGGGRRGALSYLWLTAVGVAIGVSLVLLTLTALPALQGREFRGAWHATSAQTATSARDGALWLATGDHYLGRDLLRIHVAALGPQPPVPPGLAHLPGPGEVAVSPALRDLLATTTPDTLADRLPGRVSAVIDSAGLATPDELVAVIGRTPDQLRELGADRVTGIETSRPGTLDTPTIRVLVTIGAVGLLVPVLVFIAAVTRVAASRRELRFAALRLVGATRGQVAAMAIAETSLATIPGVALGWLGYLVAQPVVARAVTFDGDRFMPEDVSAPTAQLVTVLVGVPLLAAAATAAGLRRAQVSPLGTRRRTRARRPGWWRLAPVAIGIAGLVTIAATDYTNTTRSSVTTAQILIGTTFGSLLIGLVLAGPLLCSLVARLLGRISRRLPELMAARRIAADPYTTFRAISGVALAALVTTMFAGTARGVNANLDRPDEDALRTNAIEVLLASAPSRDLGSVIASLPGVRQTVVARQAAGATSLAVSCPDLAAAVNVDCGTGLSPYGRLPLGLMGITHLEPPDETLPVHAIYVVADDDPASTERVRTVVATLAPTAVASTGRDLVELDHRQLNELEGGLRLAMMFVVLVAAAGLTVGVAASLVERRRPFALLRATGVHIRELQRMVMLETALPLIATTVFGVGFGLATSAAVTTAMGQRWSGPGTGFALTMAAGVLLALAVSATVLPLVRSATEHDAVRYE
jgi:hypothetical protein